MADEGQKPAAEGQAAPGGQPQVVQVPVDFSSLATGYVNWFRFTGTAEELIIDLGLAAQLGQLPVTEPIKVTHRLVMSFVTSKRLLLSLNRAVTTYENHYGPLEVDPHKRGRAAPGAAGRPPGASA
jgi:Protein of unknown function (DUF3467)